MIASGHTDGFGRRRLGFLFCVFFVLLQQPAFAQDARLTRITVSNTRDDLLLYFTLEGAFSENLEKAILSGVPATFTFNIGLYRVRNLWFNKEITYLKLTHTIKYDNLKKIFTVFRSWKEGDPVTTADVEEAKQLMCEIDSLQVFPLEAIQKGRQYQIRAMAEVSRLTLPLYLHYVLFSLWDVETDWYTIDFIF